MTTFRFYAELRDFLRGDPLRELSADRAATRSVKDAVESFGVPHTEVDLVLADGVPVDLAHRLLGHERISVYPAFRRIDVTAVTKVRSEPLEPVAFVADVHLGALARYLRLLGFDTAFDRAASDGDLARRAAAERRILLTRDRGLLQRRAIEHGMFIRDDEPDRQLDDVVRRLRLGPQLRPFTRCMACNGEVLPVAKDAVASRLPPHTRATVDTFRRCRACDRIYWEGSHLPRLLELVTRAGSAQGACQPT